MTKITDCRETKQRWIFAEKVPAGTWFYGKIGCQLNQHLHFRTSCGISSMSDPGMFWSGIDIYGIKIVDYQPVEVEIVVKENL
jgi:hypothetical protein